MRQAQFSFRRVNRILSLLGTVSRRSLLFCRSQDRVRAGSFGTTCLEVWEFLVYTTSAGGGSRSLAGTLELCLSEPWPVPGAGAGSGTLQAAGMGREEWALGHWGPINQAVIQNSQPG